MSEKILNVGYKSQWDDDASKSNNDCGPASIAMVANYYDPANPKTTDQITRLTGSTGGLVTLSQMAAAILALGFTYRFLADATPEHIKALVDAGIPPIALVHYGSLSSTQDKNFKGGHFMPIVGYRDDTYFANDPNFKGQFRKDGDHHAYKKAEFEKAWADSALDKNPKNALLIIYPKAKVVGTRGAVVSDNGVFVRSRPEMGPNTDPKITPGTTVFVEGVVTGQEVLNNKNWYKLVGQEAYIWSGAIRLETQPQPETPDVPLPPAPDPQEDALRAGEVLQVAIATDPNFVTTTGNKFGNAEGAARYFAGTWSNIIVAAKKSPSLLEKIFGLA